MERDDRYDIYKDWFLPTTSVPFTGIKLRKSDKTPDENTPLYTITWAIIYGVFSPALALGYFKKIKNKLVMKGTRSRDNITALLVYLARIGYLSSAKKVKLLPHCIHPEDFIFCSYVKRRFWVYPFLPFVFFSWLYMAVTKYKVRPDLLEWASNGFKDKRRKIFKTDSEILFWLSTNLPKNYRFVHWSAKLIIPLFKRKFGEDYVQKMMDTFYLEADHPNRSYKELMPKTKEAEARKENEVKNVH